MGRNKLSILEKTRALTLLEQGSSVIHVAAELKVTRMTIYNLKKAAASVPPATVPHRKPGSGAPKKTSLRADNIIKREVLSDPAITAVAIKGKHSELLKDVSVRTIQHRLQKDLKMTTRRAAKKQMLTEAMKETRLQSCKRSPEACERAAQAGMSVCAAEEGRELLSSAVTSQQVSPDIKYIVKKEEPTYVVEDVVSELDNDTPGADVETCSVMPLGRGTPPSGRCDLGAGLGGESPAVVKREPSASPPHDARAAHVKDEPCAFPFSVHSVDVKHEPHEDLAPNGVVEKDTRWERPPRLLKEGHEGAEFRVASVLAKDDTAALLDGACLMGGVVCDADRRASSAIQESFVSQDSSTPHDSGPGVDYSAPQGDSSWSSYSDAESLLSPGEVIPSQFVDRLIASDVPSCTSTYSTTSSSNSCTTSCSTFSTTSCSTSSISSCSTFSTTSCSTFSTTSCSTFSTTSCSTSSTTSCSTSSTTSSSPARAAAEVDKQYFCDACEFSTSWKQCLVTHQACKHATEKPFACTLCPYATARRHLLKDHLVSRHSLEKPFECDLCDFTTATKYNLKLHVTTKHSSDKPFKCDLCDYSTARKYHLKDHKVANHGVGEPMQCQFCHFSTARKSDLKIHVISKHSSEKRFVCDFCEYSTARKHSFKQHQIAIHSSEKPYKCELCDYTCSRKACLKDHSRARHSSSKPFKCELCKYSSARKQGVRTHIATKHGTGGLHKCHESSCINSDQSVN